MWQCCTFLGIAPFNVPYSLKAQSSSVIADLSRLQGLVDVNRAFALKPPARSPGGRVLSDIRIFHQQRGV
jgi:hypothetical protein